MKFTIKTLMILIVSLLQLTNSFSQDLCTPVGWATQNGGVTGGGNATPTVVTNYTDLKAAITNASVKVVHVSGIITIPSGGRISFQDQTGKTIYGLPGSKLVSTDLSKAGSGILYVKRCTNIIFRNLTLEGPGAYDTDGWDNMCLDNSTRIWVDHCEFQDGMDGNLDVKTASDYISITWCKFIYNKAPIAGGSGGSNDHRFTNLFGSSDGSTGDRGKLRVTLQNNWWAQGCRERMPRVRFGKVHMVNNLFNSSVSNKCIMAGFEADLLVEANVFENVKSPIDKMDNNFTAITARDNIFTNVTGNTTGSGTSFTPPYTISITPAANVKTQVMAGAGATLSSPSCSVTPPVSYTLSTTASPTAGGTVSGAGTYNAGTVVTVTATPAVGYTFTGWSGDATGTNTTTTVTMSANKNITANFIVTPPPVTYTLTSAASPVAGGTVSGAGSYNSGTVVTVTATPLAGYTFTGWSGDASGTATSTTVTMSSNKSVTANFIVTPPVTYTLTTTASPAAGGTISGAGTYNAGTVVTVTATTAAGYTFTGWSGDASGTATSTTVTMSSDKSVTANFIVIPPVTYTLTTTASPAAGGTISGAGTYNAGTVVTVTTTPAAGYTFTGWSGDASGTATSTTVTMSSNKSVTANFQTTGGGGSTTIRIEDNATPTTGLCLYEGSISSNSGANNGKVINLTNSVAKGINWKVNSPTGGSYNLTWRYVNSSTSNTYTMSLLINGTVINSAVPFAKTASSSVFSTTSVTVNLNAGNNTIRIQSVASNATADIDWIEITGNNPTAANCAAARPIINPVELNAKNTIYPNPAKGQTYINFSTTNTDKVSIKVYDQLGRMVDDLGTKQYNKGNYQIPYAVKKHVSGNYFVQIINSEGKTKAHKLIIL